MTTERTKGLELFKLARDLRGTGMDAWAKLTLVVTNSRAYTQVTAAMGAPALFVKAVMRKPAEVAMAQVLAQLQMPSREEVLSISQRLTRIEMVLDDLGATLETVRAAAASQQRSAVRERTGNGAAVVAPEAPVRPFVASKEQ
jgi:hypothetical protein